MGAAIHVFSCLDCELMIVDRPDVLAVRCPICTLYLDCFTTYKLMAIAEDIQMKKQS
jgi:hypothetical protein